MIVAMKKIFLIVQGKDAPEAVNALRGLGAIHVEHEKIPKGSDVSELKSQIRVIKQVIDVLIEKHAHEESLNRDDWRQRGEEIIGLLDETDKLQEDIIKRQVPINQWKSWGDFDPEDIRALAGQGVYFQLYRIPANKFKSVPSDIIIEEINRSAGTVFCVVISDKKVDLPFEALALPSMGLSKLELLQEEAKAKIVEAKNRIKELCKYKKGFQNILEELKLELKYQETLAGMHQDEGLVYLKGFCPVDKSDALKEAAIKEKWALHVEDPSDDDKVPTLLKNPKWVEIIKPVFNIMNILPGYKEVDISIFFLLFFSVFFGMLIGDAGYGAMFFILTLMGHIKLGRKLEDKSVFILMYILSLCAVIWGVLTGTFFGQEWLPQTVKPLLPWLRENENIQMLCFLIGAIHLSIAHIWRGVIKAPSIAAIAEIGWLSLLWGMFFLAKLLIIGDPFPVFGGAFFIVGPVLIILFSKPKKNILKTVGLGLGDLLLNLFNTFTDVVSYIRLFAVGLATVAVADAFNQMAMEIGMGSVLAGLAAALILVFGHLLNLILGAMAILVHGVRLNVLEFSSHLNMEWTGITYDPLRSTKDVKT